MIDDVKREIEELHQFFQEWFTATLPNTDSAFARAGVLGADFRMVVPNGALVERGPVLAQLRAAYGKQPGIRIWVEHVTVHQAQGDLLLATYDEVQSVSGQNSTRVSTVLFAKDASTPNGLRWLHVHETWKEGES